MATPFTDELVDEEIRRLVAEAITNGGTLSTADCVAAVKQVYPSCGLSRRLIADKIPMAAAAAGVAIEIGSTKKRASG